MKIIDSVRRCPTSLLIINLIYDHEMAFVKPPLNKMYKVTLNMIIYVYCLDTFYKYFHLENRRRLFSLNNNIETRRQYNSDRDSL